MVVVNIGRLGKFCNFEGVLCHCLDKHDFAMVLTCSLSFILKISTRGLGLSFNLVRVFVNIYVDFGSAIENHFYRLRHGSVTF